MNFPLVESFTVPKTQSSVRHFFPGTKMRAMREIGVYLLLFQLKSKNHKEKDNSKFLVPSQKTWTLYMFLVISSFLKIVSHNLHLNTFHKYYQTQWKIYKSASSNFYGSWLSFPGHEQSRKFVLGTPKILSPAQLLKGFLPRCRTCRCRHCSYNTGRSSRVDTLVDFYQEMDYWKIFVNHKGPFTNYISTILQ